MNSIYKVIYSQALNTFVVVSEITRGKSKSSKGSSETVSNNKFKNISFFLTALSVAVLAGTGNAFAAQDAVCGADGETVVNNNTGEVACGFNAHASADQSIAVGQNTISTAIGDMAIGTGAKADGTTNSNRGVYNNGTVKTETASAALAIGAGASATGRNAMAIGAGAQASNTGWIAIPAQARADNVAIGAASLANYGGVAAGFKATASGSGAVSIGIGSNAPAINMIAIGNGAGSSISSNTNGIAIGLGAGANWQSGTGSVAIGGGAGTYNRGNTNYSMGANTGQYVDGADDYSFGIEAGRYVKGSQNTAFGYATGAIVNGNNNYSYGRGTRGTLTSGDNSAVAGQWVNGNDNLSMGTNAGQHIGQMDAKLENNAVVFSNATNKSNRNIALGFEANKFSYDEPLMTSDNIALGTSSKASGGDAIAQGSSATASGDSSVALGKGAQATGNSAIAQGDAAQASGSYAIAQGANSSATGVSAIALGQDATATKNSSVALGQMAQSTGAQAFAGGYDAQASGAQSLTIGSSSRASAQGAVALGWNANASKQSAVALGRDSTTDTSAQTVTQGKVGNIIYGGFAGTVSGTGMQVSVGSVGNERQIKNVAAGAISSTSTDAINGSQLYAVANEFNNIPVVYTDAEGNKLVKANDGQYYSPSDVGADGSPNSGAAPVANIVASVQSATGSTTTPTTLANVAGNLEGAKAGTTAPTTNAEAPTNTDGIKNNAATVGDVLNAGWNLQGNGSAVDFVKPYDTVNFADGTGTTASVENTDGKTSTVKINVKTTALSTDSDGKVTANETGNSFATAENVANVINNVVTNTTSQFAGDNSDVTVKRKPAETLSIKGGADADKLSDNNIGTVGNADGSITVKLAKNINLGDDGSVTTGNTVINTDGFKINNIDPNKIVSVTSLGLNNGGNQITNVASGLGNTTLENAIGNVLTNAVNVGDLKNAVNSITQSQNGGGFGLQDVNGNAVKKNLGETVIVKGGLDSNANAAATNIRVDVENDAVVIKMAQDLKDLNSVTIGSGNNATTLTSSSNGLSVGGNKITNVASGFGNKTEAEIKQAIANGTLSADEKTNAANIGDLLAVQNNVTNVTSNYQQTLGKDYVDETGKLTDKGKEALVTYEVSGQKERENNSIIESIVQVKEQGTKYFHVNGGQAVTGTRTNTEDASASGVKSTAVGYQASAEGENAIAMGNASKATGKNSIAIGTSNVVSGENSGAVGNPNTVSGNSSYAVGNNNKITTNSTYALGSNITKTTDNSVFLGDNASSNGVHTTANGGSYTYAGANDANVAGGNNVKGVVSVGNANETRQIQNVAPGVVSKNSTDAVNGSQLYDTHRVINNIGQDMHKMNKDLRAGIAGAAALGMQAQPTRAGKSMISLSGSTYRDQSAMALGASRVSDNEKWVVKLGASADTRKNYIVGGAVGYQF
ncbi:trimeric autotransporter adhesin [Pasteurella langaaensis DSM 22999]|uniref:Trimeric autotransporter adhesin n=1 Tax=Alitibacter langaaensis DSM 22999 TaxID=1122935 RepID=A0A2U0SN09_9PAST|nr:YadA-like family protein [Pasteurella langaaensis]PVX32735.1 trimeric autotransporter adhesin [Pasteurella langaaensis DSM 22999]